MATKEIQDKLSSIERLRDVVNLSAETLLGGTFTDVARDEFWDGKGQEFHIKQGNRIVCRIIEIPEDGLSFREVKTKLKRQGKKGGELFSIVVTSQSGEGDLLEKKLTGSIKFVRVESRISSDSVDVKHDLRYFEVDPNVVEPLYIDYLNELQINGRSLSEMEEDVTEIFSIKRITKNFYRDFSDIFHDKLKPAINGLENEEENLTSYAQLVVNRILFLMFVQEKGWLNENKSYIQDRYSEIREDDEKDAYEDFFKPLFFEALNDTHDSPDHLGRIPYLNGGLFEERTEEEDVEIDEEFFEALLSPEEDEFGDKEGFLLRYKLSLSENNPAEQELVVDPEFIGRIFEMFMVSEERSEKGAFYTPKEITQYMSKNAIKQLLLNELPEKEEEISQLVLNHTTEGLENEELETIQKELKDINVLDPAVGSGAFIIAVMEELVEIQEAINDELGREENRFEMKEHMIARNLYGVDIDESGIELCKFRTWLHLIQDLHISLDELIEENDRYALPNLDFKFFVGNSLAGDFKPTEVIEKMKDEASFQTKLGDEHNDSNSILSLAQEVQELRKEFTNTHGDEKEELAEEIDKRLQKLENSVSWHEKDYFMDEVVEKAGSNFKWSVKMPEIMLNDGFDIVIGNPPYSGGGNSPSYVNELGKFYDSKLDYYTRIPRMQYDLYQKFVLRSEELVKDDGVVSYITSRTFLTIGSKETTRNLLQKNRLIDLVIANENTFDAQVNPAIFSYKKTRSESDYRFNFVDASEKDISNYRELVKNSDIKGFPIHTPEIALYRQNLRKAFFQPTDKNIEIYDKYIKTIKNTHERWREELQESTKLEENKESIKKELQDLETGDVSLFGLLAIGGRGLDTGSNEDFIAYIDGTEEAEEIKSRNENFEYESKNSEKYRWISRVVKEEQILDPEKISDKEKQIGVEEEPSWAKIIKGKGKPYYSEINECINWSRESVRRLKQSEGAYWRGSRYYFEEGLFISRGGTGNPVIRYVNNAVVEGSGAIYIPIIDRVSTKYLLGVLNSSIVQHIINVFINGTVNTQVNDIRLTPIPIPSQDQQSEVERLVDECIEARKKGDEELLDEKKEKIESKVQEIYGVDLDGE